MRSDSITHVRAPGWKNRPAPIPGRGCRRRRLNHALSVLSPSSFLNSFFRVPTLYYGHPFCVPLVRGSTVCSTDNRPTRVIRISQNKKLSRCWQTSATRCYIYIRVSRVALHLLQLPKSYLHAEHCCSRFCAWRTSFRLPRLRLLFATYCRQNRIQTVYNSLKFSRLLVRVLWQNSKIMTSVRSCRGRLKYWQPELKAIA